MKEITLKKNMIVENSGILGYTSDGFGIAKCHGMTVFVPGAARGDICNIRILKVLSTRAYGKIEELVSPSPHRIDSGCPHFPTCGGCHFRHISYEEQLFAKAAHVKDAMNRLGRFDIENVDIVPSPDIDFYRNKAQFPVGTDESGPFFGFFRRQSHSLVKLDSCAIQKEPLVDLARVVTSWAGDFNIDIYNEQAQTGRLRHIYVRTTSKGSHLCLVVRSPLKAAEKAGLIQAVTARFPHLAGIVENINPKNTNVILGDETRLIRGEPTLKETLQGHDFLLSPHSFFQVNDKITRQIYSHIIDLAGGGKNRLALDLYCGIGTITLTLAPHFERVLGVEIVPSAIEDARENAARNNISNAEFFLGDGGKLASTLQQQGLRPDLVVADPPRKGMGAEALEAVVSMGPQRIIYVACDPSSLARDCAFLRQQGYELRHIEAFDMFPQTAHVETVALMTRNDT